MPFIVVQPIHTNIDSNRILKAVGVKNSNDITPIIYDDYEPARQVASTIPLGAVIRQSDFKHYVKVDELEKAIKNAKKAVR